jgi:DNA-binding transcriptional regulator YiaG
MCYKQHQDVFRLGEEMALQREMSGVKDRDIATLLKDKDEFAAVLAQTFEPTEIVRLLSAMDLRPSDLALALNVHPRTIRAWLDDSERTADRQRDEILALKSIVLFLLRQGPYAPKHLGIWLVEPNSRLDFRRPLAVLGEGDSDEALVKVMKASAPFVQPQESQLPYRQSVAAGAPGRGAEESREEGHEEHDGESSEASESL